MAWPAESATIGNTVIIGIAIQVVCFPITTASPSSLVPIQRLIAATIGMLVTTYSALALATCDPPADFHTTIGKCHFKPPIWDSCIRSIAPQDNKSR